MNYEADVFVQSSPVEYAVVVVRLVQILYRRGTCVLEEKTRQNSASIFARVGHGEGRGRRSEVQSMVIT